MSNDATETKTDLQNLIDTLKESVDWPAIERLVPLALAVLREFRDPADLDPLKCYPLSFLAKAWGWAPAQNFYSFRERLKEMGVTIYTTGRQKCEFVLLQDIMDKFHEGSQSWRNEMKS